MWLRVILLIVKNSGSHALDFLLGNGLRMLHRLRGYGHYSRIRFLLLGHVITPYVTTDSMQKVSLAVVATPRENRGPACRRSDYCAVLIFHACLKNRPPRKALERRSEPTPGSAIPPNRPKSFRGQTIRPGWLRRRAAPRCLTSIRARAAH